MLTMENILTIGDRLEKAYEDLAESIKDAARATEDANAARIALENERARVLRDTDPADLGSNEAARKAAVAELVAGEAQDVADAEREERRAKAALEVAKAEVSAAKRAKEILELAAKVLPVGSAAVPLAAADWNEAPAPAAPAAPTWLTGERVLVTWLDGRQEAATVVGYEPAFCMYAIVHGDADEAQVPASYLSSLPEDWTPPAVVNVTASPVGPSEDEATVTPEQVAHLTALADRAFPTGLTRWLWSHHRLSKPEFDLLKVAQFKLLCGQFEAKIAEREKKKGPKGAKPKATDEATPAEEAPPAPAATEEAPSPAEEPAPPAPVADEEEDEFAGLDAA